MLDSGRATKADLRRIFELACQSARHAGINPDGWTLYPGSVTNGVAYTVISSSGHPFPVIGGFVGKTARQAFDTLEAMRQAWDAVARATVVRYAVSARLTWEADGWSRSYDLPTFYLDSRVQGIVSEEGARKIAQDIVTAGGNAIPDSTFIAHIDVVREG